MRMGTPGAARARTPAAVGGEEYRGAAVTGREAAGAQPYSDIEEIARWTGRGRSQVRQILAEHAEERREAEPDRLFIPDWYR